MPAFKGKLTDEQIKQIADYVSQNAGRASRVARRRARRSSRGAAELARHLATR